MTKPMIRCMGWPIGMKLVFFWVVLEAIIGTLQCWYWANVTHEFFPHITLQGSYALVAYLANLIILIFAMFYRRRMFVGICLVVSIVHMFVTLHWNLEVGCALLELYRSGARLADINLGSYTIWMGWNSFVFLAWALVFWCLARYEVSIRKDEEATTEVSNK